MGGKGGISLREMSSQGVYGTKVTWGDKEREGTPKTEKWLHGFYGWSLSQLCISHNHEIFQGSLRAL